MFFGVVKEWERHALFFLGKFSRMVEPGLYFYVPFLHRVLYKIDLRIISHNVPSQRGLTRDNIPVEVDAIMYYQVKDPKAAILNVDDYHFATRLSALSAMRDMVGKSTLDELLGERDKIGTLLQQHIEGFSSQWGVTVHSVEVKDVIVAKELEEAISREAEAEREKRARVKLAEAEVLAADTILDAAKRYEGNITALQIRSMNMLYEMCMEGESTMVFVPTERTIGGMPSFVGIESIADLLKKRNGEPAKPEGSS
jgi:regulator of protease activity HflC (stomatin/prohibitin superfamily)